jgi:hypothetical protein
MLLLLTMPLLGGGKCAFFYSSGDDDDDDKEANETDLVVVVGEGTLVDAPVQGVRYESGSLTGITGNNGEFRYEVGNTVRFSIGDIVLGGPIAGKALVTPLDMVENGTADTPAVINIARLLQSLDSEPGDEVITIPQEVRAAALHSNEALSSAIEILDFSDEAAFVNAASQLVAVLTGDYPFTAVLVDADQARAHLTRSLGAR